MGFFFLKLEWCLSFCFRETLKLFSYEDFNQPFPKPTVKHKTKQNTTAVLLRDSCLSFHFTSPSTNSEKSFLSPAVSNSFCNSSNDEYSLTSNARNLHYTRETHEYAQICQSIIIDSVTFPSAIVLNYTFCVLSVLLFQTVHSSFSLCISFHLSPHLLWRFSEESGTPK